jgi:signal peptidase I
LSVILVNGHTTRYHPRVPNATDPFSPAPGETATTSDRGTSPSAPAAPHEPSIIETIQSLIVAFVLAMTFRGFVVEGFVIPTGSMAPTLMGAHARLHSRQTGYDFAVGLDRSGADLRPGEAVDPMIGPAYTRSAQVSGPTRERMGDRILVLKCLYPFSGPQRYDAVVFKNPTRSQGDEANYIKRLIGLPNEDIWLCDGDVFASPTDAGAFRVQRKPDHVQRAVWQPVHDSDFVPINPRRLEEESGRRWSGPPWVGDASVWDLTGRVYRCASDQLNVLQWDSSRRELNDWNAYNMLQPMHGPDRRPVPVSDLRICATITPQRAGLNTTLELRARGCVFEFTIQENSGMAEAIMRMRPDEEGGLPPQVTEKRATITLSAGRAFALECWHVDQSMRLFIDGREVVEPLMYDWSPVQRLQGASGRFDSDDARLLVSLPISAPHLRWTFQGTPLTLGRVRVDRDLYYRKAPQPQSVNPISDAGRERAARENRPIPQSGAPAFGTHPDNLGRLGPDQFMMCGDNSPMSLDSRLWGNPDALVASQIDPSPFVVNRKLLLGKAWLVYFPAPYSIKKEGLPVIPDFGRLRFIR